MAEANLKMPKVKGTRKRTRLRAKRDNRLMKINSKIDLLKDYIQKYNSIYVFSCQDVRSHILTRVADLLEWKDSKIFSIGNKITQGALKYFILSKTDWPDLTALSDAMKGPSGLLLTNRPPGEVKLWFNKFSVWDYPLEGYVVDVTVKLDKGPLSLFQPEIEPHLKDLGMDTAVVDGVVMLQRPFIVCKPGDRLTFRQVYFLELLGEKLSVFHLRLKAIWTKTDGLELVDRLDESDCEQVEEANSD